LIEIARAVQKRWKLKHEPMFDIERMVAMLALRQNNELWLESLADDLVTALECSGARVMAMRR
jgi:hypothetical protein